MSEIEQQPGGIVVEMRCPAETRVLPMIRHFVVCAATHMGFGPDDVLKIELSVDEACSNVVRHAYATADGRNRSGLGLMIRLETCSDCLKVTVVDSGIGSASGEHAGVPDLAAYVQRENPGGLGTYIMGRFMDEVVFRFPSPHGTEVTLVKKVQEQASSEPK
ncbi:MAG: ATP-binding protein [Candidatus Sumerlaeota bacterium]|nr:ATP-binding protein [Candidatus Sumerlaeota bacterium]